MSRAIVDPNDLVLFARQLSEFNSDLHERLVGLQSKFGQLSETWRDQEQQRFAMEFEQAVRMLAHFREVAEGHIPYLLKKAEAAQAYLDQR